MPAKKRTVKKTKSHKKMEATTIHSIPSEEQVTPLTLDSMSDFITKITTAYIDHAISLQNLYSRKNYDEYLDEEAKHSWIVNLKSILVPTWADVDLSNHPFVDSKDDITEFFYHLSEDERSHFPFDITAFSEPSIREEHFTALFENQFNEEIDQLDSSHPVKFGLSRLHSYLEKMATFFSYKRNRDEEILFREKLYHIGTLLCLNDKMPRYTTLEKCKYSFHLLRMIASLKLFLQMKYQEAYDCVDLTNLTDYLNHVFIPILGLIRAYTYLENGDLLFNMDKSDMWVTTTSTPKPEWCELSEEEVEEIHKRQKLDNALLKERQRRVVQEDRRRHTTEEIRTPPKMAAPVVNPRFLQIEKERAAEAAAAIAAYKPKKVSKMLRRWEKNESKPGESILFYENDSYTKNVLSTTLNGKVKRFSLQKLVKELPDLLRNKRNKAHFMQSTNVFFGRKVIDMIDAERGYAYPNSLYNAIISFCEEIASTPVDADELRMNIIQNYYGNKKDDEPLKQYIYNMRLDMFDSIIEYFGLYSHA